VSTSNGKALVLTGDGAANIRVSDDRQDTERQYAAVRAFEQRHGVTVPQRHWFKDQGWARDTADVRPAFQSLMKAAESGRVKWIVVDQLDRFGCKNAKQLFAYLYRLEEAGCRLFDASGREWTGEDDATEVSAWVEGKKSKREQTSNSHRVLGAKAERARDGEWQSGLPPLGLDVVCFSRGTDQELWRVVHDGPDRRAKVYPDGRTECYDGPRNFPSHQDQTEVMRFAPSRDGAKVDAARNLFKRYAAESVSPGELARWLNRLKHRNARGGLFQGKDVRRLLANPIYTGVYAWNRSHSGKFGAFRDGRVVPDTSYGERETANARDDWTRSRRLFEPLVDPETWEAVQGKLARETVRAKAPRSPELYLSGLLFCAGCGEPMVGGRDRRGALQYHCGTYQKFANRGNPRACPCRRNGISQRVLDRALGHALRESGQRLELLRGDLDTGRLTGPLEGQEETAWQGFRDGIARLTGYLAQHHPEEYNAILEEQSRKAEEDEAAVKNSVPARPGLLAEKGGRLLEAHRAALASPPGEHRDEFVEACLDVFRTAFDPAVADAELSDLEAQHDRLVKDWRDLPTPRAKVKAKARLEALEARMEELERLKADADGAVRRRWQEMQELSLAITEATQAIRVDAPERSLRHKAEAVRRAVRRIDCAFTYGPDGREVTITAHPALGEPVEVREGRGAPLPRPGALLPAYWSASRRNSAESRTGSRAVSGDIRSRQKAAR
jgi:DNA invertase Pin-like site-specific DNA recombinase